MKGAGKCVTRDTDASTSRKRAPRTGARGPPRVRPAPPPGASASKPDWPRVGDLVALMWTDQRIMEGIVIDARDRGWDPPMLTVLENGGGTLMWSSPNVRIISRRKRRRRRRK